MEPYRFGRFAIDLEQRRLLSEGDPVALGDTGFRILVALVENAGSFVTKEELLSRIWGKSAIGDNRLHVHINTLRKTIGDDCIVTKRALGYCFVGKVRKPRSRSQDRSQLGNLSNVRAADEGPSRLIGRRGQVRAVLELLAHGRLVTLTGPGGIGKTRLALHVAKKCSSDFTDGTWLIELAAIKNPEIVANTVASALGVKCGENSNPAETLVRHLRRKKMLLVLDNCEHVIPAAADLCDALLGGAPEITILATSREPLACYGEQSFELPPLEVPHIKTAQAEALRSAAAIELFLERAQAASAGFRVSDESLPTVARICRRVDGLPLAIEMVAAWAGALGLDTLESRLDKSKSTLLRSGTKTPERQVSLHATLEWSFGLLSDAERMALRRLAVFAGGFTLEAAEAVIADATLPEEEVFERLVALVRKSMVSTESASGVQRYRLLRTTQAFILERFKDSNEEAILRQRHSEYVLRLLKKSVTEWEVTSDAVWLDQYSPILDDVRAALEWTSGQETDDFVALAGASWPLWRELTLLIEGKRWLKEAALRLREDTPPLLEARLRHGLGTMLTNSIDAQSSFSELDRAVAIYRSLGETAHLGRALCSSAFVLAMLGRLEEAQRVVSESLSLLEHAGWQRVLADAYSAQLIVASCRGDYKTAIESGERSKHLSALVGADRTALINAVNLLEAKLQSADASGAVCDGRELVERLRATTNSDLLGYSSKILVAALIEEGKLDEALAIVREFSPLLRDNGMLFSIFDHLALRACSAGRSKDAVRIAGYADSIFRGASRQREPIGRRAVERLADLLSKVLSTTEVGQLKSEGASFNEDQALSLATRT